MFNMPTEGIVDVTRWHPAVVHFPVALLVTATALETLAFFLRRPAMRRVALWNLSLGTLGAALAVLTGLEAEAVAKHSFEIWQVMDFHKRLGFVTLSLAAVVTAIRLIRRDQLPTWARAVVLAMMGTFTGSVIWGAYLGGRLVYEFGVGGPFGR